MLSAIGAAFCGASTGAFAGRHRGRAFRAFAACALIGPLQLAAQGSLGGGDNSTVFDAQGSEALLGPHQVLRWGAGGLLEASPPETWQRLRGPIGTVCVTGDDRIGKSTLLTLWVRAIAGASGRRFAFRAGHTLRSQTQGLWSSLVPSYVSKRRLHLNLCDSQGLKQVSEVEQWRLFSANVLTPNVLVYMLLNVFQNDQVRDLAVMARQFQQLSAESFDRFGHTLSPHLIVVVRDESDLGGARSLSGHLEEVLHSRGFAEDKALIRRVFRTREAWPLLELPTEARSLVRARYDLDGRGFAAPPALDDDAWPPGSQPWRQSGLAVLGRALAALDSQFADLPHGGPELAEWYRSIAKTVNEQEGASLGRLIGHSELLMRSNWRRSFLQVWGGRALGALLASFVIFALGNCLSRWIDRTAWCVWLVLCVLYMGTSQLITASLGSALSGYCDALSSGGLLPKLVGVDYLLQGACREASPHTAAVLLAVVFGVLSYPIVTSQLRAMARWARQLPRALRYPTAMASGLLFAHLVTIHDGGLDGWESPWSDASFLRASAAAGVALTCVAVGSAARLAFVLQHNRRCMLAGSFGRQLHLYIAARVDDVRELERSAAWREHYSQHGKADALWRYRRLPTWHYVALCGQSSALLGWAWLIRPHCDVLLCAGAALNVFGAISWGALSLARSLRRRCLRAGGPVELWLEDLDAASSEDGEQSEDQEASPGESPEPLGPEETQEEACRRISLEAMRSAQEQLTTRAMWWQPEE